MPAKQKPTDLSSMINQDAIFGADASLPKLFEASVDALRPNPDQPRQVFDDEALNELVASIKLHGLLQPIIVTTDPENKRTGISRRYPACE